MADYHCTEKMQFVDVLILLLVEYGLWPVLVGNSPLFAVHGLNPSFSGIWPVARRNQQERKSNSLNPSFSGIWPVAINRFRLPLHRKNPVLILLLVEYGLWQKK